MLPFERPGLSQEEARYEGLVGCIVLLRRHSLRYFPWAESFFYPYMEDQSHVRVLTQLVERLTDKKHAELDSDALRRLKRLCKGIGDSAIKTCFNLLMEKIREQHARVCLCTLA